MQFFPLICFWIFLPVKLLSIHHCCKLHDKKKQCRFTLAITCTIQCLSILYLHNSTSLACLNICKYRALATQSLTLEALTQQNGQTLKVSEYLSVFDHFVALPLTGLMIKSARMKSLVRNRTW